MARDYHHGDLPAALRAATVELIAERGPGSFSLREVARRAGVSHAAPAHHFGDTKGLLTSVATEGFAHLAEQMRASVPNDGSPRDRLMACGTAYVTTALQNPGHYRVMIGPDYTDPEDEDLLISSVGAYQSLLDVVHVLRDELNPDLDVDATATLLWATVVGLVELAPKLDHVATSTATASNSIQYLLERFADLVIDGVRAPQPPR